MIWLGLFTVINTIIDIIGTILTVIINLFPPSPFNISLPAPVTDLLGYANYFIPLSEMLLVVEGWLVAISVYYIYSQWARFTKTIQ